jgi:hypothetical protein
MESTILARPRLKQEKRGGMGFVGRRKQPRNSGGAEGTIRSVSPMLEFSVPFEGVLGKAA